jgi:hypothetical protein
MQEYQDEQVPKALRREDSLGKEITLPQRLGVKFQKLVPSPNTSLWTGIEAVTYEDVLDGVT